MRVLVAIDGGPTGEEVLAAAAHLLDEHDEIHVLNVVNPHEVHETVSTGETTVHVESVGIPTADGRIVPSQIVVRTPVETNTQASDRVHARHLEQLRETIRKTLPKRDHWTPHVVMSPHPGEEILELAQQLQVHGIAMGTRGRGGIATALLGSVAEHIIRHSPVPVLIVRQGLHIPRVADTPSA